MQPRAAALLWDLHTAAMRIQEFVAGLNAPVTAVDALLIEAGPPMTKDGRGA